MAELLARARLQPSLLDRLTDFEPGSTSESRERRVLSLPQLRAAVLRDLVWLLNTARQLPEEFDEFKEVDKSVLNYGVDSLTGRRASSLRASDVEAMLIGAIERYEPRILSRTLKVRVITEQAGGRPSTLVLEIQGSLWAQPLPEALFLRTKVDLETGQFTLEQR
jgi:type VI secretion system protein ImpF